MGVRFFVRWMVVEGSYLLSVQLSGRRPDLRVEVSGLGEVQEAEKRSFSQKLRFLT